MNYDDTPIIDTADLDCMRKEDVMPTVHELIDGYPNNSESVNFLRFRNGKIVKKI
ncbi:MAG: hypothetical protein V4485_06455 [Pseudomonadota bacterium]